MTTDYARGYYSTATHRRREMGYHQPRNFSGTPCKTTPDHFLRSGNRPRKKMMATQQNTRSYYNKTAHPLSDIQQGSHVVLQNPRTKLWDTNGVVISVDQHRKYHIKIKSGNIVTRNRRFLRRRVPAMNSQTEHINTQQSQPTSPSTAPVPRRSSRTKRKPQRLVEDPLWN